MTSQALYLWFPGNADAALRWYNEVFGGDLELHTYAEFGRHDGPHDAIAHGSLSGPVQLFAADAAGDEDAVDMRGVSVALLGVADPATLTTWFDKLAAGGRVLDPLQQRAWGAHDGQVQDQFGVRWLIGFESEHEVEVLTGA